MLTSGIIHVFIIEIQQRIRASKDLSRSLRVITWLWRTRKEFMYTVFESRKGNLRRAFFIPIQSILIQPYFPLFPSFLFLFSWWTLTIPLFASLLYFSQCFLFLLVQSKQVYFFQIFHTRVTIPPLLYFSFHNKSISPTSTMLQAR